MRSGAGPFPDQDKIVEPGVLLGRPLDADGADDFQQTGHELSLVGVSVWSNVTK